MHPPARGTATHPLTFQAGGAGQRGWGAGRQLHEELGRGVQVPGQRGRVLQRRGTLHGLLRRGEGREGGRHGAFIACNAEWQEPPSCTGRKEHNRQKLPHCAPCNVAWRGENPHLLHHALQAQPSAGRLAALAILPRQALRGASGGRGASCRKRQVQLYGKGTGAVQGQIHGLPGTPNQCRTGCPCSSQRSCLPPSQCPRPPWLMGDSASAKSMSDMVRPVPQL